MDISLLFEEIEEILIKNDAIVYELLNPGIEPKPTTIQAIMLLSGGLILGIVLLNIKGKFNKYLGIGMILINLVLTPILLARALV
jgi:hypothetical protein